MATLAFSRSSFAALVVFLVFICFQDHHISEALVLEQKFSAKVSTEMKVNLPADDVWAVFKSPDYMKLMARLAPDFYKSVVYVSGNGGVGTILNVTVAPGTAGEYWYDTITKLDDKTRTRVQRHIQGRFANAGMSHFAGIYNIIKTGESSSIIRFSIVYDIRKDSLSNATVAIATWDQATLISDYVNARRSKPVVLRKEFSGKITSYLEVNLPANEVWKEYSRQDFGYHMLRLMPHYYKYVFYQKGNGALGTISNITLQPEFGSTNWLEQLYRIDATKMTRTTRYVKGRYLDSGYTEFTTIYEVIQETEKFCVVRESARYQIKPNSLTSIFTLLPFWDQSIAIANYRNSLKN